MSSVYQHIHKKLEGKKCAAFDMDDTLVSGAYTSLYPFPGAKEKLMQLVKDGYNIIVISNQKKPRMTDRMVKAKINAVIDFYDIPVHFFCAREEDTYRKPYTGILELIPQSYGKVEYFVGDADGSEGSHSECDIEFARRAGIPFYIPEEFFNSFPVVKSTEIPISIKPGKINFLTMVILCGYPASGKTTYAVNVLKDFYRINRDELKSMTKCIKVTEKKLSEGVNVVVDNLNSTKDSRSKFIQVARQTGATIVVIWMKTNMHNAMARNKRREKKISDIVYWKFRKEFEMPSIEEGIDEIYTVL